LVSRHSLVSNKDVIDLPECLVLEEALETNTTVTASITTTDSEVHLYVIYREYADYEYPYVYGDALIGNETCYNNLSLVADECQNSEAVNSGTFNIAKNGVYYIFQKSDNYDERLFNGTISVNFNGVTHTLVIPQNANAYEAWAGYALEVYQGEIKVIELNKEASTGE